MKWVESELHIIDLMSRSWYCPVCDCDKYFCNCWAFDGEHLSIVNTPPAQLQLQLQYSQQHQVNTPSVQLQLQYSQQHYANSSVNVCSILLDLIHKRYSKANNILQTFVIAVPAIFLDNKTTLEFQPIWYKSWQMFAPSAEKLNQAMSTWLVWLNSSAK